MEESKVALIPKVIVQGALGPKEYGLLLTDRRSIFVLEVSSKAGLGGILGGAIGAAIAQAATSRRFVDYEHVDPEAVAHEDKNITVPHAALGRLVLRRKFGTYRLLVEYAREDGKRKKVQALVVPTPDQVKANKRVGIKPKETARHYAESVRQAYVKALPPAVAARAEWRL